MGELSQECSQIVLKMPTFGTYWTWYSVVSEQTCKIDYEMDQSTWQTVISFDLLHSSSEYKQYCRDGNTAKQCRFGLFQDSDLAGDLEDSKSTSGGTLCIFGSHTFVPLSWMCQKQTSVSHSSTESEIISLDAGFRMDGAPALDLWDLIVAVHGNTYQSNQGRGDFLHEPGSFNTSHNSKTKEISWNDRWFGQCWFYFFKRPFFSWESFIVYLWRQRSSHQNDHKGKKPHNETCFQNPRSCSWLVVW